MRSIRAFLGAFLIAAPALPLAAQMPPLPSDPGLQEAYFAWDRGAYDEALIGYLEALTGPGGAGHLEEIALLSGELFQVEEWRGTVARTSGWLPIPRTPSMRLGRPGRPSRGWWISALAELQYLPFLGLAPRLPERITWRTW